MIPIFFYHSLSDAYSVKPILSWPHLFSNIHHSLFAFTFQNPRTLAECDMLDQGVTMGQKEHLLQARKPVSVIPDMNSLPYHSLPPPSFAISPGAYMDGAHQANAQYLNDQQQKQQPQQFFNPIQSHPVQTVDGDLNRGYFSAYPVYPTSIAPHISTPGFQVPTLYDPGLGTPPMNHGPTYSLDPRIPASRSVEQDYAHREKLCGSLQSENKYELQVTLNVPVLLPFTFDH